MVGLDGIVTEVASLFGEMSDEESFHDFGEGELIVTLIQTLMGLSLKLQYGGRRRRSTVDSPAEKSSTQKQGRTFDVDNPNELDVFLNFIDNHLWVLMVDERNRNTEQKLGDRFSSLRYYQLFWTTDDFFGNHGIKRTMSKNWYEELVCYIHFNDSSKDSATTIACIKLDRFFIISSISMRLTLSPQRTFVQMKV